jgi:hypothetical protein
LAAANIRGKMKIQTQCNTRGYSLPPCKTQILREGCFTPRIIHAQPSQKPTCITLGLDFHFPTYFTLGLFEFYSSQKPPPSPSPQNPHEIRGYYTGDKTHVLYAAVLPGMGVFSRSHAHVLKWVVVIGTPSRRWS